jgi:hypothetical protein
VISSSESPFSKTVGYWVHPHFPVPWHFRALLLQLPGSASWLSGPMHVWVYMHQYKPSLQGGTVASRSASMKSPFQRSAGTRLRGQIFLLSEFLERHAANYQPPRLARKVLLHGHRHQKALMKMTHAESLLRKMGAEVQSLDAGCCGMAGPFGFELEKYAIAQASGERVLLPTVRQASPDTLIISDGFSCREQVFQSTGRRALHLAEVIVLATNS